MNLPHLNALAPAFRLAFMVAALWLLIACDAEELTATAVPSPSATPSPSAVPTPTAIASPTVAPTLTAAPRPTAVPTPTAAPSPTAVPTPTATHSPTATPSPTAPPQDASEFSFDFGTDAQGWVVGFADLPADYDQSIYELAHEHRRLPDGLEGSGIYVQGHNRSDDLFMFLKKRVDGLRPDMTYAVSVSIDLATNIPFGLVGIGGSPGESVYVKAGATTIEPVAAEGGNRHLRMNIDKGNQSNGGESMVVLGNVAHPEVTDDEYRVKALDNTGMPLSVTTDSTGQAWLIVGTDSGFEGLSRLYYARISYVLAPGEPTAIVRPTPDHAGALVPT